MKYQEYINLGFKRTDIYDSVEFKETGYYGYSLQKTISNKILICVNSGELDSPKMYIRKKCEGEYYHILDITVEMAKDLCS